MWRWRESGWRSYAGVMQWRQLAASISNGGLISARLL